MKFNLRLITLGLIAFFVFLLVSAPATIVTGTVSRYAAVKFSHVSGTVWRGQAGSISARGIVVGPVSWKIHPWRLLRGELASDIMIESEGTANDVTGSLWLGLALPGVLRIRDADINADAKWAFATAAIPIVATGRIVVQIRDLNARERSLPEIDASVRWANAGVSYPQKYQLGAYNIALQHEPETDPQHIVADISDESRVLHINGQAQLDGQGQYQLDVLVSADANAPEDIKRVLPMLALWGTQQKDGSVKVQHNGRLSDYM